ncbi:sensor domain-containing protein [Peribacillus kribbensis]|uniref:sensor domain-containing protein n=1 Tax=Peribacillus kribbensis TaxID=356658 RepID=UPI000479EB18|nr:EAL domain-containing protein [Peribacillus kribbensis]
MNNLNARLKKEIGNFSNRETIEKIIFDIVFKHVKDMLFIMKAEGKGQFRYLFANKVGIEKASLDAGCAGMLIQEVLPPEKADEIIYYYNQVIETGSIVSFKDNAAAMDGSTFFGESILTPVRDDSGEIQIIVSVTRDITETVHEKHALIESQERFRSIIDHNMDSIFSLDLKGSILSTNNSAYSTTGYTEKELQDSEIFLYWKDSDRQNFNNLFEQSIKGKALESSELAFTHKSGEKIQVHLRTIPIIISETVKGIYLIMRNISSQLHNIETIKYMAFHDQLTGLLNRPALIRDLDEMIAAERLQAKKEIAILSIDLDRFKLLNDSLGHNMGDILLRDFANRIAGIPGYDYRVYRQGGDEFTILIKNVNKAETEEFAGILFKLLKFPFVLNRQDYYISSSIGISMYPGDGFDSESLIRKADGALRQVKERGKSHYQFYSKEILLHQPNIVVMESNLRRAIDKRELTLYYQPQVNLLTNEIESLEALLRWHNPTLGYVSPAEFIPLAEDTALIVPIGEWVFEEVCRQMVEWDEKGLNELKVAINLSPKQFLQPQLVDKIKVTIEKYRIRPSRLEVEITEGAIQDISESLTIVKRLKEIGLSISVDDFGTGYSSLSYLKQFPLDTLKIDQSFVKEILSDQKDAAITTTIIHLAQSLGLEVIAEGVELPEQAGFLKDANCQKVQGFLYSRPLPPAEVEKLLNRTIAL